MCKMLNNLKKKNNTNSNNSKATVANAPSRVLLWVSSTQQSKDFAWDPQSQHLQYKNSR